MKKSPPDKKAWSTRKACCVVGVALVVATAHGVWAQGVSTTNPARADAGAAKGSVASPAVMPQSVPGGRTPVTTAGPAPAGTSSKSLSGALWGAPSGMSAGVSSSALTSSRGLDCMIQPHQIVQVGVATPGVVDQILVDRGEFVSRGQTLVRMQSGVERAALAVARERATQLGELKVAEGSSELARRELERAHELHQQNFVSQTYLDKQRAEV